MIYTDVKNIDKPSIGIWDLKSEKVFDIDKYGKKSMAMPKFETINKNGIFVVYDYKLRKNFLFSSDGKFIRSFGKKGEGPGEIKRQRNIFSVSGDFIASDGYKIHYFSKTGSYLKSIPLKRSFGSPAMFINNDQYISYKNDKKFKVNWVDLIKMEKRTVVEESAAKEDVNLAEGKFRISIVIPPITPRTFFAFDPETKLSYFGRNDNYMIKVMNFKGKIINTFSVDRKKMPVTKKMKKKINKEMHMSKKMWKKIPHELTYFNNIKVINNHLYIFNTNFEEYYEKQQIDIFSLNGKYLYSTSFQPEDEELMFGNVYLCKEFLFAVIQTEDGDMKISKYKISLPE